MLKTKEDTRHFIVAAQSGTVGGLRHYVDSTGTKLPYNKIDTSVAVYDIVELKNGTAKFFQSGDELALDSDLGSSPSETLEGIWKEKYRARSEAAVTELDMPINTVIPRILRPTIDIPFRQSLGKRLTVRDYSDAWLPDREKLDYSDLFDFRTSINLLMARFSSISKSVFPCNDNLSVFGHEIRELHILACIEVEALWRTVLKANEMKVERSRTTEYVRLCRPMKLDRYELRFSGMPRLKSFRPYDGWDRSKPTETLPWYNSYQMAKHDRVAHFSESTLANALDALAACVIMVEAQFGELFWLNSGSLHETVHFDCRPNWDFNEYYVHWEKGTLNRKPLSTSKDA